MSPIKEPRFFAAADLGPGVEGAPQLPLPVRRWEDYVALFRDVRDEIAIGEATVAYFGLPSAPRAIRARLPEARFLFILRDPAERLFSAYVASRWRDPRISFRQQFVAALDAGNFWTSSVRVGCYATHLERFLQVFPRGQMRIFLYEDFQTDAAGMLRDIFTFLGVDPDWPVDLTDRHNETMTPRLPSLHRLRHHLFENASVLSWVPRPARAALRRLYHRRRADIPMDPADRAMVIDHYHGEILRTAELIHRDLAAWLR